MIEFTQPLTVILVANSLLTITLIFNQNESIKDSSQTGSNPFENLTWICFFFQLFFLLLKTKITDF